MTWSVGVCWEPPFPGSFIAAKVKALYAPCHGIASVICQGSHHIPWLASIGCSCAPCRIPVLSGLALWV